MNTVKNICQCGVEWPVTAEIAGYQDIKKNLCQKCLDYTNPCADLHKRKLKAFHYSDKNK